MEIRRQLDQQRKWKAEVVRRTTSAKAAAAQTEKSTATK
jgi:hypothetical protein